LLSEICCDQCIAYQVGLRRMVGRELWPDIRCGIGACALSVSSSVP